MDAKKDYYAILGVHQTAEDLVIKVAYRALAQKYHPDTFSGSRKDAHQRMSLINEAYDVLSNPESKKEYDKSRGPGTHDAESFYDEEENFDESTDPFKNDWEFAVDYNPVLGSIDKKLLQISVRLSYTFRAYLLETKEFADAAKIAEQMEQVFMREYFGTDPEILNFARFVVSTGNKNAARDLNKAVCVFGKGIAAEKVIMRICEKFKLNYNTKRQKEAQEETKRQERLKQQEKRAYEKLTGQN